MNEKLMKILLTSHTNNGRIGQLFKKLYNQIERNELHGCQMETSITLQNVTYNRLDFVQCEESENTNLESIYRILLFLKINSEGRKFVLFIGQKFYQVEQFLENYQTEYQKIQFSTNELIFDPKKYVLKTSQILRKTTVAKECKNYQKGRDEYFYRSKFNQKIETLEYLNTQKYVCICKQIEDPNCSSFSCGICSKQFHNKCFKLPEEEKIDWNVCKKCCKKY